MNKKGFSMNELAPLAISFVIIAVVIGVGATVLSSTQTTLGQSACVGGHYWNTTDPLKPFCAVGGTDNSTAWQNYAYNASGYGLTSVNTLSSWLPTIAVIVAAAVVIGIIVAYFRFG